MSSMSPIVESPRRRLTERQAEMVRRLTEAALEQIRASGYEGLTVRNVASRAGVAAATAYTYFVSKDHLIAEVFWRRLRELPLTQPSGKTSGAARIGASLSPLTSFLASEPRLAAATTTALLAEDPDVKHLRDRVGGFIRRRIVDALGDDADENVVNALELCVAGAMIQAGMGHLDYEQLPALVERVAGLLLRDHR